MKVSIVTSVLNAADDLPKCIGSVESQTHPCEHVIVDGGSSDGSQEVVRRTGLPHLHLIDAPGTEISEAFNLGIQCCSGDVIAILNADDWFVNDAVERSVQSLVEHPHAGFTYGSVILHSPKYAMIVHPMCISENLVSQATWQMLFYHISSFVRRCVYYEHGMYDVRYKVAMDYDFYARIISRGIGGVYVPGVIAHATGGGVSSNIKTRSKDYYHILSHYYGKTQARYYVTKFAINSCLYEAVVRNRFLWGFLNSLSKRQIVIDPGEA